MHIPQEAYRNYKAAFQQLRQEAVEAIKCKHDEIFQQWFKNGVLCFNIDRTKELPTYGFQQVIITQLELSKQS